MEAIASGAPFNRGHLFDLDCVCVDCGFDAAEWHHWKRHTYEGRANTTARQPLCTAVGRPADVYQPIGFDYED